MPAATLTDPILDRFHAALATFYGPRLERVVLFGSRARGDHRSDSDYDVAVFLHDLGGLWDELGPLSDITTEILMGTGMVISAKPFPAGAHSEDRPLMREIARDGVTL